MTIENEILTEFEKRSGIEVNTNKQRFVELCGFNALYAPGCYNIPQQKCNEILHFIKETIEVTDNCAPLEVLFHEMAHATGLRLGRNMRMREKDNYAYEEAIAEGTSMKLHQYFGWLTPESKVNHIKYIRQWLPAMTPEQKTSANSKANEAMKYILENWLVDFTTKYKSMAEQKAA